MARRRELPESSVSQHAMEGRQTHQILHAARTVAACALGGAVAFSLGLGWMPALAAIDSHAVGAAIGGALGVAASLRETV
jgi:hypothetical protein